MDHEKTNQGKETVTITINDKQYEVHRGRQTVVDLKTLAEIPLAYELNHIVNSKLVPLPDEDGITIKGGEEFISNPKDGVSS
jgi:hypothetical protein